MITRSVNLGLTCIECPEQLQLTKRSNREAAKAARSLGWLVKGEIARCPKHKQIASAYRQQEHSPRGANAAHHTSPLRTTSHQERA